MEKSVLADKSDSGEKPQSVPDSEAVNNSVSSARQSIIRILPPREKEVLDMDRFPRITTLPLGTHILRVEYSLDLQQQLTAFLANNNFPETTKSLPPLRSPMDKFGMTQIIVTDPSSLDCLIKAIAHEMNFKTALSNEQTPVLLINGCIYPLYLDFADDTHLPQSFVNPPTAAVLQINARDYEAVGRKMRLGPCSYLSINTGIFAQDKMAKEVLDHMAVLTQSKDFVVVFDQMGNMVILAFQERAAGRLLLWATALKKLTRSKVHMLFGKGSITHADEDNLVIDTYLTARNNTFFQELGQKMPDLYSTDSYLAKMEGTRDKTLIEITSKEPAKGFIPINVIRRVNYAACGGPDKMVGYKDQYETIKSALNPVNTCRLVFVEGDAGTGKSRIIHEVADELPNVIRTSVDPAGRNITGFSLVDLAAQLGDDIKSRLKNLRVIPQRIRLLLNFNEQSENARLMEANRSPESVCVYIQEALASLEKEIGPFTIIIDDIHHHDRLSDGHIMDLLEDFLSKKNSYSKAVLLRRPESRYASAAQESLKKSIGNVTTVGLNGQLNFADRAVADEYILHSLPDEIRINPETGQPRIIGDWANELGKRCKTPFEMTSYLQGIAMPWSEYLTVNKEQIELTPKGSKKITKSLGQEMVIYHLARIEEEKLSTECLTLLQTFSLVGFSHSFREYIEKFLNLAFGYPAEQTDQIIQELQAKGYLVAERKFLFSGETDDDMEPITMYRIWHENLRDIILNFTLDEKGKEEISTTVYRAAAQMKLVSDDQIFSIMQHAARKKDIKERDFWTDYMNYGNKTLKYAAQNNLFTQGYNVATMILEKLQSEEKSSPEKPSTMVQALTDLTYGEDLPEGFKKFIINTLKAMAHHGYYVGEMEKVHDVISVMESIQLQFPDENLGMPDLYEIGFDAAYFQSNKPKLAEYLEKMQEKGVDDAKIKIYQLRAAYSHRQTDLCNQIIASYGEEELPLEVERLKYRIELQAIYRDLIASGVDGDAAYSGLDLTPDQTRRVWVVRLAMDGFRKKFTAASKAEKNAKKRNHPIMELSLLDIEGDAAAFLGVYKQAIKCFSEIWRLAMQMEIPRQALFAAKRKGDLEIMQAVVQEHAGKNANCQSLLRSAIFTYTEEGLNVAKKLTDKVWLDLFHVQRLRAISMFLEAVLKQEDQTNDANTQDLQTIIEMGFADIEAIENSEGAKNLPGDFFDESAGEEYEDCYYITPYLCSFITCCEKLGCECIPQEPYKFESAGCIQAGQHYARQFREDKMDELARKMRGLQAYAVHPAV